MQKINRRRKKKKAEEERRIPITRIAADPEQGLSAADVAVRVQAGYTNAPVESPSKTTGQIIASNVFTYFNILFFALAILVLAVGQFREIMFMGVVLVNLFIGIIQELRSQKMLDKLSILSAPKATVIRDGQSQSIRTEDLVLDDIVIFKSGMQICADAVVVEGEVQVNEALVTGESDEITKSPGSELLSGSFVISGTCKARLQKVGRDAFVSKLTLEAKKGGKPKQSEMLRSLTRLVQIIGIIIIPVGIMLFYNQHFVLGLEVGPAVAKTVGAVVGMIPEGLYLLTTLALVASTIRLAQRRTLLHEMGCIETLARVDVLCVDKTGTITEDKMVVDGVVSLCEDRFIESDIQMLMADFCGNMPAENETMRALAAYFGADCSQRAEKIFPFSSATKYSGVYYGENVSHVVGAPEMILGSRYGEYEAQIEAYSKQGSRVLLLAIYDGNLNQKIDSSLVFPVALLLLSNKIRAEAPKTFQFFEEQGVEVKVISGDNPVTVSAVAIKAGIRNGDKYVDARTLDTKEKIRDAAQKYTVFGRVTPDQKRKLVRALKAAGHTVAMTGDGVNDILALKEADCSIAMASGSDVAAQVSNLVLLDSNFASMPSVVAEGRRVINNIERSAALFLVKNIFSFFLALISLAATLPYPISAAQLSLMNVFTIGIPSFILALEPNENRITGRFLRNVLYRALPAGLTDVLLILGATLFTYAFDLPSQSLSTIATITLSTVGLMMLFKICRPFNTLRRVLWGGCAAGLVFCLLFMKDFFLISSLDYGSTLVLVVFMLLSWPVMWVISKGLDKTKTFVGARAETVQKNKKRKRRRKAQ